MDTKVEEFNKVTIGYVIQNYKTLDNGTHVCTGQEFIAGDVLKQEEMDSPIVAPTMVQTVVPTVVPVIVPVQFQAESLI